MMTAVKRATGLLLLVVTLFSVTFAFPANAAAASTSVTSKAVCDSNRDGYLDPKWNSIYYLKGKRTYTVRASAGELSGPLAQKATNADVNGAKSKMRFDITVIEADGSKSTYYGKCSGFSFKLAKNRDYKIYVTSYTSDYRTCKYGTKASTLATALKYTIK